MQLLSTFHPPNGLPSPTLTNPDMILPYGSPSDPTPAAPGSAQQIPSPPPFEKTASAEGSDTDGGDEMKGAVRKLFRNGDRSKTQNTADREATNPLDSDSGMDGSSVLASPPVLHDDQALSGTQAAESDWNGFDGAQGGRDTPDEEIADFKDVGLPTYAFPPLDNEKDGFSAPPDIEDDDPYSHAAMSIRAEQILANAKKRLTNMEGNLNRARSTLHNRPSSSMSSFSNRSPDPVSLYTIPKGNLSPSKHRQMYPPSSVVSNKGHNRVFSETSVPSSLHTQGQRQAGDIPAAAASIVVDASSLDSSGERKPENAHNWFWTGLTRNTSYTQRHNNQLPALEEDGPATESFEPSPTAGDVVEEEEDDDDDDVESKPLSKQMEPLKSTSSQFESSPTMGLTRARSTTQMRDLRDQMQDLKGKISSLKRRAREDSMRRRSMQSLRTPSPFTAAENWYGDESGLRQGSPRISNGTGSNSADGKHRSRESDQSSESGRDPTIKALKDPGQGFDDTGFDLTPRNYPPTHLTPSEKTQSEGTSETPIEGSLSGSSTESPVKASGRRLDDIVQDPDLISEQDSLYGDQDYHETSPSPVGERHEDRPDAFDYETFFLHSGTGTLARKGHSRNSSHSSMYSVETTRPTYTLTEDSIEPRNDAKSIPAEASPRRAISRQKERGHMRSDSGESISTVATFATATEGKGSDGEGDEDEWILHRPMAGAWTNDQSSKRKTSLRSLYSSSSDLARTGSGSSKRMAGSRKVAPNANGVNAIPVPIPSVPAHHLDGAPVSPSSTTLAVLSREAAQMSEGDRNTIEMLVNSLSKVCARLKEGGEENARYEERVWRRRLDTARRVLDGEMNGEAF